MQEMKFWFGAKAINPDELSSPEPGYPIVLNIRITIGGIDQSSLLYVTTESAHGMIQQLLTAIDDATAQPSSRRAISDADGL